MDAESTCDNVEDTEDLKITNIVLPIMYDSLQPSFEGLDPAFEKVVQGLLTLIIESQNLIVVNALKSFIKFKSKEIARYSNI